MCPCAEHQVSVSAVDHCGREGQRSPSIIPEQDSFSDTEMCELAPSTNPGINIMFVSYGCAISNNIMQSTVREGANEDLYIS